MTEQEQTKRLEYLLEKERVCGLDKEERWEIQKLIEINN